jgi:CRP-like cAMP-binding protein
MIGLFEGLSEPQLEVVATNARARHLSKGDRIFNQGDINVRAHALIAGSVRITQSGNDGAQAVVRFIAPGEIFGTVALFTDGRYPADATTLADTLEVSWSEPDLLRLMVGHPRIAVNLVRIIGRRLGESQERGRELSTQRAEQRIANALVRLSRQAGHPGPGGVTIDFPLKRKDVADISGVTQYTASRILTAWERSGLVRTDSQRLTIRPAELLDVANRS